MLGHLKFPYEALNQFWTVPFGARVYTAKSSSEIYALVKYHAALSCNS